MKLLILGASGRVGSIILQRALHDGHEVKVLVREAKESETFGQAEVILGDALNPSDILTAMQSCEGVISALNSGGSKTISNSMQFIILSMKELGIRRIVTIGTSGILNSYQDPAKLRFETNENLRTVTDAALDHLEAFRMLEGSELDWTIVCPTKLVVTPASGTYRVKKNFLPEQGTHISIKDTANFAYEEFFAKQYVRSRVGIACL